MGRKPAFLLLEVVVALALFVSGVAVCMHVMAQLTSQQKEIHKRLMRFHE